MDPSAFQISGKYNYLTKIENDIVLYAIWAGSITVVSADVSNGEFHPKQGGIFVKEGSEETPLPWEQFLAYEGSSFSYTANPDPGYQFIRWSRDWVLETVSTVSVLSEICSSSATYYAEFAFVNTVTNGTYIVIAGALNVRDTPSTSGSRIGGLTYGDVVEVTGSSGKWAKINYDGKDGWVDSTYLVLTYSKENAIKPESYIVTAGALNVRAEPSESSERIGGLSKDDEVLVTGKITDEDGNEWLILEYPTEKGSQVGFIMTKYAGEKDDVLADESVKDLQIGSLPENITPKSAAEPTRIAEGTTAVVEDENIKVNEDGTLYFVVYPDDGQNFAGISAANIILPEDSNYIVQSAALNEDGSVGVTLAEVQPE